VKSSFRTSGPRLGRPVAWNIGAPGSGFGWPASLTCFLTYLGDSFRDLHPWRPGRGAAGNSSTFPGFWKKHISVRFLLAFALRVCVSARPAPGLSSGYRGQTIRRASGAAASGMHSPIRLKKSHPPLKSAVVHGPFSRAGTARAFFPIA